MIYIVAIFFLFHSPVKKNTTDNVVDMHHPIGHALHIPAVP